MRYCAAYALEHCADDLAYFENVSHLSSTCFLVLPPFSISDIANNRTLEWRLTRIPLYPGLPSRREGAESETAERG